MGEERDQSGRTGYLFALTDEGAYLETEADEKPDLTAERMPDLAKFKCWFCRKSHQQVKRLFGAPYPVRDPDNFSHETPIFICDECVAEFAEWLAQESSEAPS